MQEASKTFEMGQHPHLVTSAVFIPLHSHFTSQNDELNRAKD